MHARKKVFVGLSGGVDSSVTAALLKRQGYDVVGVFIKIWQPEFTECSWPEDRRSAMRVAAHLRIPFLTVDLSKEYQRDVLASMVAEYRRGRTPNPDVVCNRDIKFGAFLRFAREQGADYIATGHYARVKRVGKRFELHAGIDPEKDQSYFLWTLTTKQLSRVLFPIGSLYKSQVRTLARRFRLPTAERPDSQGLCFVGELNLKDFLGHYIRPKRGAVRDETGQTIGVHEGAAFYTPGQRHGFSIDTTAATSAPYYVTQVNVRTNTLTVSRAPLTTSQAVTRARVLKLNGISGRRVAGARLYARLRYRQALQPVTLAGSTVRFAKATLIPHGQSIVFYRNSQCLGGGVLA